MTHTPPTRTADRRLHRLLLGCLAIVVAASVAGLGHPPGSSSTTSFGEILGGDHHSGLGEDDGVVRGDVTVFDDATPAVAELDPDLRRALRRAATAARKDGIELHVNSGWRSAAYQEELLRRAISTYGSRAAAARWVATPATSPHVSGDAVDIGKSDATAWLSAYGASYGLCQIYGNERWHFELRPDAVPHGCPPEYVDPTHDPRMRT